MDEKENGIERKKERGGKDRKGENESMDTREGGKEKKG